MEASSSSTSTSSSLVQSCTKCPDKFLSNDKLTLHYVINHKYHICEVCTTVSPSLDDLKNHESETHLPIKCEICCYQITELSELTVHRATNHQLLTCHFCPLTLNTVFELNFHLKRKHFVLVEPLNIDQGLWRDFNMSKWGYLCLLCGKNRETSGFIGHYRGFHRIRVPTLAKILTKQNISLSIMGTIGEGEPSKELDEDIANQSLEEPFNNNNNSVTSQSMSQSVSPSVHQSTHESFVDFIEHLSGNGVAGNRYQASDATNDTGLLYSMLLQGNKSDDMTQIGSPPAEINDPVKDSSPDDRPAAISTPLPAATPPDLNESSEELDSSRTDLELSKDDLDSSRIDADLSRDELNSTKDDLNSTKDDLNLTKDDLNLTKEEEESDLETSEDEDLDSSGSRRGDSAPSSSRLSAPAETRLYQDFDEVEPDVDPNDIECVLTETSDVDSAMSEDDDESEKEMMTKLYNMAMQGAPSTAHIVSNRIEDMDEKRDCIEGVPRKLGNYLVLNNLVISSKLGLNQMEHAPGGFRCEHCHGYFDSREGLKEYLRHMRTLHGIKCNRDTRNMNSVFDNFGRVKMMSYPEYCGPIHVCPFCSLRASSKRFLRRHVFTFHGDTWLQDPPAGPLSYGCGAGGCKRAFWFMTERDAHEMKEHEDTMTHLRCHICVRPFLRKVLVNQHIRHAHPEETESHRCVSYKCKTCDVLLFNYSSLDAHTKAMHSANYVYRCSHCDLGLKNMKSLRYHIKMQHGKASQQFECELCGRVTYSLRSLNSHRRLKHDQQHRTGFKCRLCEDNFPSKDERQLHYANDHVNQQPFVCPECNKGFASKSGLYGHRQVHKVKEQVQENFFKCQFCGKEFTRRDSYNEHLLIHMGPRHKCPHCNKDFVQRSNLVRHIRIHTGEKPYKCTHCDKTFSDKGACNSHIRVHTGEEACACPFCGQTFSKKQKLKYHVRKHTGEGLLECEICNKTFTNSYALKDHKATHERQAVNFNCKECGSVFTENRFLNRHRAVVHSNIVCFACPFCERIFSHQRALRTHILIHAGVAYLQCGKCSARFETRTSLHDHLAAEHSISVNHELYPASVLTLEPDQVGLLMPKFSDEEILTMNNQERDEVLRDYFNQVIEGKIELATQFEFKLIQRNRKRIDPDKKDLISKLKQEQRKPRPLVRKRTNKKKTKDEWGPLGGARRRKEEEREGHGYNFRMNYPRTIMSEDFDYDQDGEDGDESDSPPQYESSVINLSMRDCRPRSEDEEEYEDALPANCVQAEMEESENEEENEQEGDVEIKEEMEEE